MLTTWDHQRCENPLSLVMSNWTVAREHTSRTGDDDVERLWCLFQGVPFSWTRGRSDADIRQMVVDGRARQEPNRERFRYWRLWNPFRSPQSYRPITRE